MASLIGLWLKVSARRQKKTCGSVEIMCVSSCMREDRGAGGGLKENACVCSVVKLIMLSSHCVYCGVQTELNDQVWHSFCSICLTGVFVFLFICSRVRVREKPREKQTRKRERSGILLDSLTHIQAHLHAVPGVVRQRLRQTRHAVVTISQDLNSHTLIFLKKGERG